MTSVGSGTFRRADVVAHALAAAGRTDSGIQREVNEDRFYVDAARGVFLVIDGVGGQAAGGKAADVALSTIRDCLERDTRPVVDRIRQAITLANNEIHRLASTRAEWEGMACVLTIAVVHDGAVTFGHVGDTRLYKMRGTRLQKVTSDHSPVGEREDAGELSELQAMRHPRRNEVYRDVGSEVHAPSDRDFIDSGEIPIEPDAALLLCTDGLTDLVDSTSIAQIVAESAGDPEAVAGRLVDAANDAGGKDNVTVVYAEGKQFGTSQWALAPGDRSARAGAADRARISRTEPSQAALVIGPPKAKPSRARRVLAALAILATLALVAGIGLMRGLRVSWVQQPSAANATAAAAGPANVVVVHPTESISAAIRNAPPESQIVVEPGEYREQIVLTDHIRLVSRVPRAAVIRLPAAAPDSAAVPAIVAPGLASAEVTGFRIVGDAATPLAIGIRVDNSAVAIVDVEISGATTAAVEFSGRASAALIASDLRDNPGAAMIIHEDASPRIAHNVFTRNGTSERAPGAVMMMTGAGPRFTGNVFLGLNPDSFVTLDRAARLTLKNENWFVPVSERRGNRAPAPGRPQRNK